MEEKDKEIATLKASLEEATKKVTTLEESNTALGEDIKKKDAIIEQKTKDVVGARKNYKSLSDMTQAEKDQLSTKELELQERQEKMEADQKEFQEKQAEQLKKEVTARQERAIANIAKGNKEVADKIKANMSRIKEYETATTDEEISRIAEEGFNMIGQPRPNPVRQAVNSTGDTGEYQPSGFADSEQGKGLAAMLGLKTPETKK